MNPQQTNEQIIEMLGFTTREVTLIGLLVVLLAISYFVIWRLYKDNKAAQVMMIELMNKSTESLNKMHTTIKIIESKQ